MFRAITQRANKLFFFTTLVIWVIACEKSDELIGKPEENRFTTTVITQPGELDEPMAFTFLNSARMVFVERKGDVKVLDVKTKKVKRIAHIPVNTKYTSKEGEVREAEEGLMGVIAHPDFENNNFVFMYYADPVDKKHVLARWELHEDSLYSDSKKILLEIPTQREVCCHTGGGMVFDKEGNLFLTTGNNTANPQQGTSALDERPGRSSWDDQRTGGNTNDLRGKILRIHPEDDGTYTIPKGNLFTEGADKTRAEIYTMGHRNPWRISIDSETGYIYWGEVGPDASRDSTIGPRGYDEFNQAKRPGFFGWPYFIADNKPYASYDYVTDAVGQKFDVEKPVNNSVNNTGLKELPKPEKAFIWYPYANSEEFPLVGSAGRSATGGPVFRKADFEKSERKFPPYYEGKWLIVEFMRGWIMSVSMDKDGNYQSMEQFLPNENFSSAIDMKFSPDGDLYVLEYGSAWFRGNINAQIKRIEYNGGNRTPVVKASADRYAGAVPLKVKLSSEGTIDYDKDELKYEWIITSNSGQKEKHSEMNPQITLENEGVYSALLTVTDANGESNSQTFELRAGNDPPRVSIDIKEGNKTFFFPNSKLTYEVSVEDKEDGSLKDNKIAEDEVSINFDYAPEGFDPIEIAQNHHATDEWSSFSKGANLIGKSDCKSCHMIDKKSVGPSYQDVAERYKNNPNSHALIAKKIITGGSGVWGEHAMSAHPQLSETDALAMVQYIISLSAKSQTEKRFPSKSTLIQNAPNGDNGRGSYLLRAAYTDKGNGSLGKLSDEKIIALRNPRLDPEKAEFQKGTKLMTTPSKSFNVIGDRSFIGYKNIDLGGIVKIDLLVQAPPRLGAVGGNIEVHLDSPDGPIIGKTDTIVPKDVNFRALMAQLTAEAKKKGQIGPPDMGSIRRLAVTTATAEVVATQGFHDIYFVFKNDKAKPEQIIAQISELVFHNQ